MPVCQTCGKKWTWIQTIKTLFRLKCPHCGTKQYESATSRKRMSLFSAMPIIVLPINILFDFVWWMVPAVMLPMIAIVWTVYPYVLELSNEDEPLW